MNILTLVGRITKDAELRYTDNDAKAVSNINLAVDDGFGDNKKTIWFRCSLWGKRAEALNQYLTKGQQVVVIGRLAHDEGNPRTWEKDGVTHANFEVYVTDIKLVGGKKAEITEEEYF